MHSVKQIFLNTVLATELVIVKTTQLLVLASLLMIGGCSKDKIGETTEGNVNNLKSIAVTGGYLSITYNSASLFGWCNQKEQEGLYAVYGIEYSSSNLTTDATKVTASSKDSGNRYTCLLNDLEPETKYYYRAFVFFNNAYSYGDVMSFTTAPISGTVKTLAASRIGWGTSTLNGELSEISSNSFSKSACFYYSTTDDTVASLRQNGDVVYVSDIASNGTFNAKISGLTKNTTYYYLAVCQVHDKELISSEIKSFKTGDIPSGSVDLGLSVAWATCNIGASSPEQLGKYYQWAGLTSVSNTTYKGYQQFDSCPYHSGTDSEKGWSKYIPSEKPSYWSGYGNPDNKTLLDSKDDIASVRLGTTWRIPTKDEWSELISYCSITRTLNYNSTGVVGFIITSLRPGYENNSIFIPAEDGILFGHQLKMDYSDDVFCYWSSSLDISDPCCACAMYSFYEDKKLSLNTLCRDFGFSVRPVAE